MAGNRAGCERSSSLSTSSAGGLAGDDQSIHPVGFEQGFDRLDLDVSLEGEGATTWVYSPLTANWLTIE